jgi:hypothetical protein
MGTEIEVYVNGSLNTSIHTSCSQPIGPGLVRGSFEIVSGFSLKGGALCPVSDELPCEPCSRSAKPVLNDSQEELILKQNSPNPFNPITTIEYVIPANNQPSAVKMDVYDIRGSHVRTLVNVVESPGTHSVVWDSKDDYGMRVASGIYLCKIQMGNIVRVNRMLLLR